MSAASRKLIIPPLSTSAPGPLYQQIVDGLKREVSEGRIPPGAPLPSFRALAEDLLVSVITVKRAYEDLERDGIIYRRQGIGTFVAEAAHSRSRDIKKQHALDLLGDALREATEAGLSVQDVISMLRTLSREGGVQKHGKARN